MSSEKIAIEPGSWVRIGQLWPGIWQVFRIITNFRENRWALEEPSVTSPRTLVFCHRIANDSWKRSFSFQSCEISYVKALEPNELRQLKKNLLSDLKLLTAFEKYRATVKPIDLVANLSFGNLGDKGVKQFLNRCDKMLANRIDIGVTLDEVLALLHAEGLDSHTRKYPVQATLQLVSPNHELRGDEFVYRRYRVLNH